MSLNSKVFLKLQLEQQIRKLPSLPETLEKLKESFNSLFGSADFSVSYQDLNGESICIKTDNDLITAYEVFKGKPSVKLFLEKPSSYPVLDRIESLRQSLLQSMSPESFSNLEIAENVSQDFLDSIESLPGIENPVCGEKNSEKIPVVEESKKAVPVKKQAKLKKLKGTKPKKEKKEKKESDDKEKKKKIAQVKLMRAINSQIKKNPISIKELLDSEKFIKTKPSSFEICENCEENISHPHSVLKICVPIKNEANPLFVQQPQKEVLNEAFSVENLKKLIKSEVKKLNKKKYKANIVKTQGPDGSVFPGSEIEVIWNLENKGKKNWPEGSRFKLVDGDFSAEDVLLPIVKSGESVNVEVYVKVPEAEKKCKGLWKIVVGDKEFGKAKLKVNAIENPNIEKLVNMGFSLEKAKLALEYNNEDIYLAISQVLKG